MAHNIHNFVPPEAGQGPLIVSGGGAHHPTLMDDLEAELPGWDIVTSQTLGIDPDFKEALLMGLLAVARMERLPGNMPAVTGAGREVILGQVAEPG